MNTNLLNVCIYLRKSRKDREHPNETIEETLKRHEDELLKYAKKENLNIIEIKKEVVTGDSIAARPKMQELLEEVEDGSYNAVLVIDIDRLGRGDQIDQGIISHAFKNSNTRILTPYKEYNLDDEYDEEFYDLAAFFARKELRMIKRRMERGKKRSLSEGNYIGSQAPYGYNKQSKTLVINPKESEIIKLIFNLYVDHDYGDTKIARYLTERNIPNKHGITIWDRTTIRHIIRNPVYTGKVCWYRRDFKYTASGKRTSTHLPRDQWMVFDGNHPAIITDDLFEKAQELSKDRYQPHLHVKHDLRNPIAYIIKCGACGHTMTLRTSKGKKDTLRCYRHCGGVASSYIELVEKKLIDQLYDTLTRLESQFDYQDENSDIEAKQLILQESLNGIETDLNKLANQKQKQFDLLEEGIYDKGTFLERSKVLAEKIESLNDKKQIVMDDLRKCQNDLKKFQDSLPKIIDAKLTINTIYWTLSPAEKNKFLLSVVDHVIYFKEKGAEKEDFELELTLKF